jgi:Holliday junction DNA helicase RuvB
VRDFAQVKANGTIKTVTQKLADVGSWPLGLDKMDTMLLLTLIDKFSGGPVGIETWQRLSETKRTRSRTCTSPLIQAGFKANARGRGDRAGVRTFRARGIAKREHFEESTSLF